MSNLKNMLKWEFLLLARYKIIHIAMASVVFYFVMTKITDSFDTSQMHSVMLFFDPAVLGLMFVGALVLFEKAENTLQSLVVTPMKTNDYIFSKIISLTILAFASSMLFMGLMIVFNNTSFNIGIMVIGIIITSIMMILLGFIIVARVNNLNGYLMAMMLVFLGLTVPSLFDLFELYESVAFYIIPTHASFVLFNGVFTEIELWEIAYGVFYQIFWIVLFYIIAKKAFYKYIVLKGG
jgi:fluoroquinolone transport system permease protein